MKTIVTAISLVLFVFVFGASAQTKPAPSPTPSPAPAKPVDMSGKWSLSVDAPGQTLGVAVEIKQTGAEFTGTTASDIGSGTIDGGKIDGKKFRATLHTDVQGQTMDFAMDGTIDGDKMNGTFTNSAYGAISFTGSRPK